MSSEEINFGEVVSNELIEKFKVRHNVTNVISIVSLRPVVGKSYGCTQRMTAEFKNKLGDIHATPELLPILGVPRLHYYIPIVEYTMYGKLPSQGYGMPATFKYLRIAPENYNKLRNIAGNIPGGDITAADITVTLEGGEKKEHFQGMNFIKFDGSVGMWKTIPELHDEIVNNMLPLFKSVVDDLIGKKVPAEAVADYLAGKPSDDIFKELSEGPYRSSVASVMRGSVSTSPQVTSGYQAPAIQGQVQQGWQQPQQQFTPPAPSLSVNAHVIQNDDMVDLDRVMNAKQVQSTEAQP